VAKRLTEIAIRHLKPGPQRREISDRANGLFVVLQPSGRRSFAVRTRVNGKPVKLTIGSWPVVSLVSARQRAATIMAELAGGQDPREAKQAAAVKAAAARAETLTAVCEEYLKREGPKLRSADQRRADLRRHVYPALGDRPISTIKRSDIVRLLDEVEDNSGARAADLTLAVLRRLMHWHSARSDDYVPPIVRGMGRWNAAEHRRSRILDDDEFRRVWAATADHAINPFSALVRFLLLSAARRSEAAGMKEGEVDDDGVWTLPPSRSKTKTEIVRPLSKAALELLNQRPRIEDCPYFFTGDGGQPFGSFSRGKRILDAASGVRGWRLHDLRRTARSLFSRAGVNSDIAERCLGHALPGIRATYDRHKYVDEMRPAFETLAAQLDRTVHPPGGKVVEGRFGRSP
jgi:integrase